MSADLADTPHILVVDDDARLRNLLRRYLSENGFAVTVAANAAEARGVLETIRFDLLIVDVMMPGETGLEFTRFWKSGEADRADPTPVLLLTAMGEVEDRIEGLESGADDYLAKPFEPRELLLRLRNLLRRTGPVAPPAPSPVQADLRMGEFRFDAVRQELWKGALRVHLTPAEQALLAALARKPGEPITRDDMAEAGIAGGQARTIDVQVTRLRRKIEPNPRLPRYLQTVRGLGYVLRPD